LPAAEPYFAHGVVSAEHGEVDAMPRVGEPRRPRPDPAASGEDDLDACDVTPREAEDVGPAQVARHADVDRAGVVLDHRVGAVAALRAELEAEARDHGRVQLRGERADAQARASFA